MGEAGVNLIPGRTLVPSRVKGRNEAIRKAEIPGRNVGAPSLAAEKTTRGPFGRVPV